MADRQIHIADKKNRDAVISFAGFTSKKKVIYVDDHQEPIQTKRYIKSTSMESYEALLEKYQDPNDVAHALLESDPDINIDMAGRYLSQASRVYVNENNQIVFKIKKTEHVYNPKGEQIEEREPRHLEANINTDRPLMWSGKGFPKTDVFRKFVFIRKYQLKHTNGLTYDMLYNMAKELADSNTMMLIGSGKGTGPAVFQEGGNPFRIFLEGRIDGDKYILLMHLSNMELKPLPTE